jgi:hypothetical protein
MWDKILELKVRIILKRQVTYATNRPAKKYKNKLVKVLKRVINKYRMITNDVSDYVNSLVGK